MRRLCLAVLLAVLPALAFPANVSIVDPQQPNNSRAAGIGKVQSDGTVAARRDGGLLVAPANTDIPSYVVNFNVAPTVAMDVVSLSLGLATKVLRLRRIVLVNPGNATAAAVVDLQLGHAVTPGSGGAVATVLPVDPNARSSGVTGGPDAASGAASARSGDTTLAGTFVAVYTPLASIAVPAAAAGFTRLTVYDALDPRFKPVTLSTNGLVVFRIPAVGAGATGFRGYVEFTVDDA